MKRSILSSKIILIAVLIFSFTSVAYAVNTLISDNTPENGYILCANKKTKIVTYPNSASCPSGSTLLDMGAAGNLKPIYATATFANVDLPASPNLYVGVVPIRASMFSGINKWHRIKVKTIAFTSINSTIIDCRVLKMESLSGSQSEGTVIDSRNPLFAGYQTTNEFSGEFIYRGGDYVLGCKSDSKVSINAEVNVQQSGEKIYK